MGVVTVYTDGSCNNDVNARDGGFGVVIRYKDDQGIIHKKDYSEGQYSNTSSARMEIMAVIRALELITTRKTHKIIINSDNQYVVKTIMLGWYRKWISRGMDKKNMDLWRRFQVIFDLHGGRSFIEVKWVRGHNGNKYNELADQLANEGRKNTTIIKDIRS